MAVEEFGPLGGWTFPYDELVAVVADRHQQVPKGPPVLGVAPEPLDPLHADVGRRGGAHTVVPALGPEVIGKQPPSSELGHSAGISGPRVDRPDRTSRSRRERG